MDYTSMSDTDKSELDDVIDELKGILALENNMVNLTFDPYEDAKKKLHDLTTRQCNQARIDAVTKLYDYRTTLDSGFSEEFKNAALANKVETYLDELHELQAQAKETEEK
jgi:Spy/CpxP family protein refolding chaperone